MHRVFRLLTLNRIGAALFVGGVILLLTGLVSVLASMMSQDSVSIHFGGLSGPQCLLLGLAGLVHSALVFGLAIVNERLARVEAKLDALGEGLASEKQPAGFRS
jgi:hypothetical protein